MGRPFPLTPRQAELLRYIHGCQLAHGIAPTFAECRAALGVPSNSYVFQRMAGLQERGAIERLPNRSRAIRVLTPPSIPTINGEPLQFIAAADLAKRAAASPANRCF